MSIQYKDNIINKEQISTLARALKIGALVSLVAKEDNTIANLGGHVVGIMATNTEGQSDYIIYLAIPKPIGNIALEESPIKVPTSLVLSMQLSVARGN